MQVIDLLNKIANGEEDDLTTEFEFQSEVYNFFKFKNDSGYCLDRWLLNQDIVITKHKEIIEEDKKIEHLLNGVDFENLKDNEKFDYLYEMETRIINYLEENK